MQIEFVLLDWKNKEENGMSWWKRGNIHLRRPWSWDRGQKAMVEKKKKKKRIVGKFQNDKMKREKSDKEKNVRIV